MILDTSALLHVAFQEPGWETSVAFLLGQPTRRTSVGSLIEAQAVLSQRTPHDPYEALNALLLDLAVDPVALTPAQGTLARRAYLRFGRGSGHPANLNFGDVMSYALARDLEEALAFVGDDFVHTDLELAPLPPR